MHKWSLIGAVGQTHGVLGDFFLKHRDSCLFDSPPKSFHLIRIAIGQDPFIFQGTLLSYRQIKGRDVLRLKGLEDGEGVNRLRSFYEKPIWWTGTSETGLGLEQVATEHELSHLKGAEVRDMNQDLLGKVKEFYSFGGGVDQLEVEAPSGKCLLIPYVSDFFEIGARTLICSRSRSDFEGLWY